jgi:hypothetical protein
MPSRMSETPDYPALAMRAIRREQGVVCIISNHRVSQDAETTLLEVALYYTVPDQVRR